MKTKELPPGLLPHQHHRAIGTVKKTAAHIARVREAQKRELTKAASRSPKWPAARRKFLASPEVQAEGCAACGSKVGLQVHHKTPFHSDPALELDPKNFIALCEYVGGLECHVFIGHGGDFKHYNPNIEADCRALRADPRLLRVIQARAKRVRRVNAPNERG